MQFAEAGNCIGLLLFICNEVMEWFSVVLIMTVNMTNVSKESVAQLEIPGGSDALPG